MRSGVATFLSKKTDCPCREEGNVNGIKCVDPRADLG